MRSNSVRARLAAAVLAGLVLAIAAPAEAGLRHHDRVYADSFGNLVIDSAAGYKRIIVGEGKLAGKLSEFTSAGQPDVVYDDEPGAPGCYQPPVLVKGRSYMYGLSDGEMPNLSPCR
ncbi:MAG: hypothetical protein EOR68_21170 [Mesorhizobium sp.]|uniref:hypothetical protein n=1 Tax=Mesorhizobium sp. TaxID=1871066 RepID=UPI000FE6A751|nr:hypothetical protein [Mesorhizobium sp.]RWL80194.1 MAG: hypothetical protein EOR69_22065 [Mesorhizobium sp.]RWL85817.1 MAG: hypothetical protein EOR67_20465 [Mesorhizobium sp.]RWL93448.1 MAG: hypothetical protein EOR70_28400 [Mesorhizobium sp.]RWL94958.1 MAG: hypothetical protein EOR68_21170 [Mesorhizobium sp.]TIP03066.1 MAG: hypothetical protein E5X72_17820 [Mesorhizobium sp.]